MWIWSICHYFSLVLIEKSAYFHGCLLKWTVLVSVIFRTPSNKMLKEKRI